MVHVSSSGAFQYGSGRKVVGLPASIRPTVSDGAEIWHRALTHKWDVDDQLPPGRTGMLNAAKDLHGTNSAEYKATNKAWQRCTSSRNQYSTTASLMNEYGRWSHRSWRASLQSAQ